MKVCILMGSPRPGGNTAELCKPFIDELRQNKAEVEYIELHGRNISACLGCGSCQNVPDTYGCVQNDDMQDVAGSILSADILVFATPVYTWQVTAPMKAVMDRMYGFIKYNDFGIGAVLNEGQAYALIATCGDVISENAGMLNDVFIKWCEHAQRPYHGMYGVQDRDGLTSFQTDEAIMGAREFAHKMLE